MMGLLLGAGLAAADGPIDPPEVIAELEPGESLYVEKEVITPEIPPKIDVCLLEDETGSFNDDIANLKDGTTASDIYEAIVAVAPDAQFAVAGFRDYPTSPYGLSGDHVYRLLSAMSADKSAWLTGITLLTAPPGAGADNPEAQYDAIVAAVGPGTFDDPTVGIQDNCGWRADLDVTRVLVVTTDAPFHVPDGTHVNDQASTIAALTAQNIVVVGLKATGAGGELDALASATGGSVQALSSDGANIAAAILAGLEELTTDVWPIVACDDGLNVTLSPGVYTAVAGGTVLTFDEWIEVPNATMPDVYECTVTFYANEYPEEGAIIGTEEITVTVVPIYTPVDIRPTSCRNPLNVKEKGVLPVAILGTEDFDVSMVDPATVRLEGVAPLRWDMEDVATPFEPYTGKADAFDCTEEGPDGFMDLTLKFDAQEVVAALGEVNDGDVLVLELTGNLTDDRAIAGEDVVVILKKGK
jgi:hypothetical protein